MSHAKTAGALFMSISVFVAARNAEAQETTPPATVTNTAATPSAQQPDESWPKVGGHIGLALPIAHIGIGGPASTVIGSDFFTLSPAYGITVKLSPKVAIDIENVVGLTFKPKGSYDSYLVDPGVIYNLGPFAIGGRVAFQVGDRTNVGVIPIINKGFPLNDKLSVFAEADFPLMFNVDGATLTPAVHVGLGF